MVAAGEDGVVEVPTAQPGMGIVAEYSIGFGAQPLEEFRHGGDAAEVGQGCRRTHQRMDVPVDASRRQSTPRSIDDFGCRTAKLEDGGQRADGNDGVPVERDGFSSRLRWILRPDVRVPNDHRGRRRHGATFCQGV